MSQEYPVTRLQAAKWLRQGQRLEVDFPRIEVVIVWQSFPKGAKARLGSNVGTLWIKLSWKQLLGFIRRNYTRSYLPIG